MFWGVEVGKAEGILIIFIVNMSRGRGDGGVGPFINLRSEKIIKKSFITIADSITDFVDSSSSEWMYIICSIVITIIMSQYNDTLYLTARR